MSEQAHQVTSDEAGERLDRLAVRLVPNLSRSKIQKAIEHGRILLNQKQVPAHHAVREGDEVIITEKLEEKAFPPFIEPTVITETDDYLVIEKPVGTLVHPIEPQDTEPTIASWLIEQYPEMKTIGEDPVRPGIVHRLDRDVSGLMVVAKSQEMYEHLKKQFQERTVQKEYLALVFGNVSDLEGTLRFTIGHGKNGKMAARPEDSDEDRQAETRFEVEKRYEHFDLLRLFPKTGRTHQIRVHLFARGHPIVGDPKYRPKHPKEKLEIQRIFLHATKLGFEDLDGEQRVFESPLPKELADILKGLRESK